MNVRVLDLTAGLAGGYCVKLLVDAGADVVRAELEGRPSMRDWPVRQAAPGDPDSPLFQYLAAGTRAVAFDLAMLPAALSDADLLVHDLPVGELDVDALLAAQPDLVVTSISPFGASGTWSGRPANEFTLQAWAGSTFQRGDPERVPLQAGGSIGEWAAGAFAAVASLASLRTSSAGGAGEHVDVSVLEATYSVHHPYIYLADRLGLVPFGGDTGPFGEMPGVVPAADGAVGFCLVSPEQVRNFFGMVGRDDLADDDSLLSARVRFDRRHELTDLVGTWATDRTVEEITRDAERLRIPCAPVLDGRGVLELEHFQEREAFVKNPHGFVQPRVPYRIEGRDGTTFDAAPERPSGPSRVTWSPRASASVVGSVDAPLAGLRVVDLTAFIAGPSATQLLASWGADVIKVESERRPDGLRMATSAPQSAQRWEFGAIFQIYNRGKRSVTIDLDTEAGLDLLRRLIASTDVVIENFTPRVMEKLGLDWAGVRALNPTVVMVRMPGFGLDGPFRDRPGFAQTMEYVTGMAAVTGYPDALPEPPRGPCDVIAGLHAVLALLVALEQRERTEEGVHVELPMSEVILNVAAESSIEQSARGVTLRRIGNRSRGAAPQGVYPGRGGERLALSVETDEQWAALLTAFPPPDGLPPTASLSERLSRHDALDGWLTDALAGRDVGEVAERLLALGVPAAPVRSPLTLLELGPLVDRGFFGELTHPVIGRHPFPAYPFQLRTRPDPVLRPPSPAPVLGEHTEAVLTEKLGLTTDEIAGLRGAGVIGAKAGHQ